MTESAESLRFESRPGLTPYREAWDYQKTLVELRARDEIPDTFLFVEHPPTVTRGRGLQRKTGGGDLASAGGSGDESAMRPVPGQAPAIAAEVRALPLGPLPPGTEYFEIERGGDLTWHGPGQLVIYPVVKLDGSGFGPDRDVTAYLRKLERVIGGWLEGYGLERRDVPDATGIWVRAAGSAREFRKIASIGIAVRKWVAYHGVGLNLANALDGFRAISPCGFSPEVMTTLAAQVPEFARERWSPAARAKTEAALAAALAGG